ncbi:hypothetical protein ACIRBX_14205, partial [Kitasatospora sp. NPDC096147]
KEESEKEGSEKEGSEKEGSEKEGSEKEGSEKEESEKEGSEKEGSEKEESEKEGSEKEGSEKEDGEKDKQQLPETSKSDKPEPSDKSKDRPKEADPRRIAGSDLVIGLTRNEQAVRQQVIDALKTSNPGDSAAIRVFGDTHFGPHTLRPMVAALSQGETVTIPLNTNGFSGSIKLSGAVTNSQKGEGIGKLEFENGADRTVSLGAGSNSLWQFNLGGQTRQTVGVADPAEAAGYHHSQGKGRVKVDLGGMVARSKTAGQAETHNKTMELKLDFTDLKHGSAPVKPGPPASDRISTVEIDVTVAVPVVIDDTGGDPRNPPKRLQNGRIGGQEIVLDLTARVESDGEGPVAEGSNGQPPKDGTGARKRPVETLLEKVDEEGRKEFGENWPAMRDKVLSEVDFARLQRDLKSMTSGEPTTVTLTDKGGRKLGTVEINAKVGELRQTGSTKETEFNIGTTVQQVQSTAKTGGKAGQLGVTGAFKSGAGLYGLGGAGRLGTDKVRIEGTNRVSQLTVKSKVPGVRYEGPVEFSMSFNGKDTAHVAGTADVKLLVDKADTTSPDSKPNGKDPEPNGKDAEPPKTDPGNEDAIEPIDPPGRDTYSPPVSVWQEGGGLGETVVVRDVAGAAELRKLVDRKGREEFGDEWDGMRDQVLQSFTQPNLAARMTGMTRGEPLEIKVPGKKNLVITATAKVETMTFRRKDDKAELNIVNETGAFSIDRRQSAGTKAVNAHLGLADKKSVPPADILATANGHRRDRVGTQDRRADRVYASGKYKAPQAIYGAGLSMDVRIGKAGETPGGGQDKGKGRADDSVTLDVEVSMDLADTTKTQVAADHDDSFGRPDDPGKVAAPEKHEPAEQHLPPARMSGQKQLNASYVVHTLNGADKVHAEVTKAIKDKYGKPSAEVQQQLDESFDRIALKTQLSQLTRGGKITESVSGTTWRADITVTARVQGAQYHSTVNNYEFESGSRTSRGNGTVQDRRDRLDAGGQLKVGIEPVDVTAAYAHRTDRTYSHGTETVGSTSNRAKHVETAAFFEVGVSYDVKVEFKRLGVDDGQAKIEPVGATARVAVPMRDVDPVTADQSPATTPEPKPQGFLAGRRLDSSAVVTDVHELPGKGSILSQVETVVKKPATASTQGQGQGQGQEQGQGQGQKTKTKTDNPFGSDRDGIRQKLEQELSPDRLQARLKGMMAGDEIVVTKGGTTVRVTAVLGDTMTRLGDSGTTEFNTGTDVQRTFADATGGHQGHQGSLGVSGSGPIAGGPVSVTGGLTGVAGKGQDHNDVRTTSTSAGSATKAKVPGSAYKAEAELQFTITRTSLFGSSVDRRTATVGFETLVETSETALGVEERDRTPRPLATEAPEPTEQRVPPDRIWASGLRDSDVLRFLGDVGGVQDLARMRGPKYFGESEWKDLAPMVGAATSHSQLSALFTSATQGAGVTAAVPTNRLTLGGGKGVDVGMKVVSLEYQGKDEAVESSPANSTGAGQVHSDQSVHNAGGRLQVGAKITGDPTHSPAAVGGVQRVWREGGGHGDAGQVVSNGKYATPMARYSGAVQVEMTFFDNGRKPVTETGVLPFTVDIPHAETGTVSVPADHYVTHTDRANGGEFRLTADPTFAGSVVSAMSETTTPFNEATATPEDRDRLAATVRVAQAAYGFEPTPAEIRAAHRLVELAGGTSEGAAALIGQLKNLPPGTAPTGEQVSGVVNYIKAWTPVVGEVSAEKLNAGRDNGWPLPAPVVVPQPQGQPVVVPQPSGSQPSGSQASGS